MAGPTQRAVAVAVAVVVVVAALLHGAAATKEQVKAAVKAEVDQGLEYARRAIGRLDEAARQGALSAAAWTHLQQEAGQLVTYADQHMQAAKAMFDAEKARGTFGPREGIRGIAGYNDLVGLVKAAGEQTAVLTGNIERAKRQTFIQAQQAMAVAAAKNKAQALATARQQAGSTPCSAWRMDDNHVGFTMDLPGAAGAAGTVSPPYGPPGSKLPMGPGHAHGYFALPKTNAAAAEGRGMELLTSYVSGSMLATGARVGPDGGLWYNMMDPSNAAFKDVTGHLNLGELHLTLGYGWTYGSIVDAKGNDVAAAAGFQVDRGHMSARSNNPDAASAATHNLAFRTPQLMLLNQFAWRWHEADIRNLFAGPGARGPNDMLVIHTVATYDDANVHPAQRCYVRENVKTPTLLRMPDYITNVIQDPVTGKAAVCWSFNNVHLIGDFTQNGNDQVFDVGVTGAMPSAIEADLKAKGIDISKLVALQVLRNPSGHTGL